MLYMMTLNHKYTIFAISLVLISLLKITNSEIVDISHILSSDSQAWPSPGVKPFKHTPIYHGLNKEGYWYSSYTFSSPEHVGTHLDAPSHFSERGWTVDKIPNERLFASAIVIDIREKVSRNKIYELTENDVENYVRENGLVPNNSVVLVHTGWSSRYNDKASYFGHVNDTSKFAFPGISVKAAQKLVSYEVLNDLAVVGVGIDTPSIDFGPSKTFPTHRFLARHNVYNLENLKDLHKLPKASSFQLIVMPLKIKDGSGSPCRVLALDTQIHTSGGTKMYISTLYTVFFAYFSTIKCFYS